jgi:hypothetical protein
MRWPLLVLAACSGKVDAGDAGIGGMDAASNEADGKVIVCSAAATNSEGTDTCTQHLQWSCEGVDDEVDGTCTTGKGFSGGCFIDMTFIRPIFDPNPASCVCMNPIPGTYRTFSKDCSFPPD